MCSWAKILLIHKPDSAQFGPYDRTGLTQNDFGLLGRDQLRISAAAADVGVLPIPMEMGIDLAVVSSNTPNAEQHAETAN
jgi:hypothetical protein